MRLLRRRLLLLLLLLLVLAAPAFAAPAFAAPAFAAPALAAALPGRPLPLAAPALASLACFLSQQGYKRCVEDVVPEPILLVFLVLDRPRHGPARGPRGGAQREAGARA